MLAIVIPYYKKVFFRATLESLAKQTNKNFKVYIGNDASPENPVEIIEQYTEKLNIVYKQFDNNLGGNSLVQHWARCIELIVDEKWVLLLGDDDILCESVVNRFYDNLNEFNLKTNVIRYSSIIINKNSEEISEIYNHPKWEEPSQSYYRKFKCLTRSSISEYIFILESYNKYGYTHYPTGWYSDDKAWLDFSDSKPIYTINDSIICIRESKFSISGKENNLPEKKYARLLFLKDIIIEKYDLFSKQQRQELIRAYETLIFALKRVTLKEYLFILRVHFQNFSVSSFKKHAIMTFKYLKTYI
ncbi:MAG: glycosyltransferase family 2 protein [Bacteroidetes bacterium HGW-Bacteroidetes-2]|jgi:hypothetical protein|nr:MAG: glycosyltransferase family 2 protein [Bacteroidetes bacterium HGW-Bacteroidetes-2]